MLFPRGKSGRGAMLTIPSSAEVKNVWSYTFAPPICLHDTDRDDFTFTVTENDKITPASVYQGRRKDEYILE
jgi:hypothetical protein